MVQSFDTHGIYFGMKNEEGIQLAIFSRNLASFYNWVIQEWIISKDGLSLFSIPVSTGRWHKVIQGQTVKLTCCLFAGGILGRYATGRLLWMS